MSASSSSSASGVQGSWRRVAALMASKPQMAAFRKFSKMNVLMLLELQSELLELEKDYEFICKKDARAGCSETQLYQSDWEKLATSGGVGGNIQREAWARLRDRLDVYSKPRQRHECSQNREKITLTMPNKLCIATAIPNQSNRWTQQPRLESPSTLATLFWR